MSSLFPCVDRGYGAISHRAVHRMAGLGWLGKNLPLVNPQYGPRIPLVTVLTDALLTIGCSIENRCGKCMLCRHTCLAEGIKDVGTYKVFFSMRAVNTYGRELSTLC